MGLNKAQDSEETAWVDRFQEILTGSWKAQALYAAAELQIADLLAEGPRSSEELAASCGAHPPSLRRLLIALCSLDICQERKDGSFELAPMGALLQKDKPGSLRAWTQWWAHYLWPVWGHLLGSVQTGQSARKLLHGTDGFEHLDKDPESAAVFYQVTVELTRLTARLVVQNYDFSGLNRIVDVGGGYGEMLAAILKLRPEATGILFDRPYAIEGAKKNFEKVHPGLDRRCEFLSGDFFESVPGGADGYVLKSVIHDWDDERSLRILETCRRAMAPEARLLLIEPILPLHRDDSPLQKTLARHDLTMLVACGAQERSEPEFRKLLKAAGFQVFKIVPTGPVFHVIEASPCKI